MTSPEPIDRISAPPGTPEYDRQFLAQAEAAANAASNLLFVRVGYAAFGLLIGFLAVCEFKRLVTERPSTDTATDIAVMLTWSSTCIYCLRKAKFARHSPTDSTRDAQMPAD